MTESELEQPSAEPAVAESAPVPSGPGFSSRRALREAGGYREAEPRVGLRGRLRRVARPAGTRDAVRSRLARAERPQWRRALSSVGVMTVVVGLLAAAVLPAFLTLPAFAEQNGLAPRSGPVDAQNYEIAAAMTDVSLSARDGYETTSAADLRRLYADAIRQQNLASYLASGAREMGDDYPWPDALSRPQGGGLSPLRYYYRECVDFVAWRLNRDAGSTSAPFAWDWSNLAQSSAYGWKRAWESRGWVTSETPVAGAVAWFPGGNHVAYVSGVLSDGSVALEEYNYSVDHGYSQRVIQPGQAYYLYPPG